MSNKVNITSTVSKKTYLTADGNCKSKRLTYGVTFLFARNSMLEKRMICYDQESMDTDVT